MKTAAKSKRPAPPLEPPPAKLKGPKPPLALPPEHLKRQVQWDVAPPTITEQAPLEPSSNEKRSRRRRALLLNKSNVEPVCPSEACHSCFGHSGYRELQVLQFEGSDPHPICEACWPIFEYTERVRQGRINSVHIIAVSNVLNNVISKSEQAELER